MGSTESAASMEDTNANEHRNQQHPVEESTSNHSIGYRFREQDTHSNTAIEHQQRIDDPWWWEIENQNLLLDVVSPPDQTSLTTPNIFNAANPSYQCTTSIKADNINYKDKEESSENFVDRSLNQKLMEDNHNKDSEARRVHREQSLEEFKEELQKKRLIRQCAVQDLRTEIASLRKQLAEEKQLTRRLQNNTDIEEVAAQPSEVVNMESCSRNRSAVIELAEVQLSLQLANADNLSLRTELNVIRKQVVSLKEVVSCCKQMISVKEEQCMQVC